jgi:hypothetical protein
MTCGWVEYVYHRFLRFPFLIASERPISLYWWELYALLSEMFRDVSGILQIIPTVSYARGFDIYRRQWRLCFILSIRIVDAWYLRHQLSQIGLTCYRTVEGS